MKIGYFVSEYPYRNHLTGKIMNKLQKWGGVENGTYNLVTQMAKRGHEVFVFTTSIDSKDSVETYQNIKIFRYKQNLTIGQAPISFSLVYKPLFSGIDLDVIHARMGNLPAPLTAYLYSKKNNKKLIVSYHGDWVSGFGGIERRLGVFLFNTFFCNLILNGADLIIGLSKNHVDESKVLKKYLRKLIFIPNGINFEEFEIPFSKEECRIRLGLHPKHKIILFVGSLILRKAPDVLIKSMKQLVTYFPEANLVFVGDGPLRKKLEMLCIEMDLQNNVRFAGYISDPNIKSMYYKAADLLVLPSSEGEAFPNVLLEASVCGLPLVVSECECFRAIVEEGYNGIFTKTGDVDDLARKISYLLSEDEMMANFGKNAKSKVGRFSWHKVAEETERLYQSLQK